MITRVRTTDLQAITRVALLAGLMAAIAIAPAVARIDWHDSYDAAVQAAEKSEKPIFVFVYLSEAGGQRSGPREQIRVDRPNTPEARHRIDVQRMLNQTLSSPEVMEAAGAFEPFKMDLRDPANDDARRKLQVSPGVDPTIQTRVAMYPLTVFLDQTGTELFRRHGCMPALGYAAQLDQAANLHEKREAVLDDPRDPVRRRELGRAYMEMDPSPEDRIYEAAVEHLEAAIRFDPDNATGANFDARVDLAILRIPDSPGESIPKLFQLQTEDDDDHRKLEIQYYMAVAHFVMEDYDSAKKLLREFETNDEDSPYWDSPWTPQALGLLEYIKQLGQ
ncbi:MAG: hypothetical protein GF393_02940 [Armatimonadia bacterium]|nr:hypothetical protein [Armatimonadia bacterium]